MFSILNYKRTATVLTFFIVHSLNVIGQNDRNRFSPLSEDVYKERINFLEKYKPGKKYEDKTQQWFYEEFINNRTQDQLRMFKKNGVLQDQLLLEKANSIFKKIVAANPGYGLDTIKLYISRDVTANAANWGEGSVFVNIGLFFWLDNDDEFAFVLAHELAHQTLKHGEQQMNTTIEKLTSDEFKAELKSIKRSDYGKYSRYKELYKGLHLENGKHSRYKESEADEWGVKFAKKAGYNIDNAVNILLKMDHVSDIFLSGKLYDLKKYLSPAEVDISSLVTKSKYKGLSSVEISMDADKDIDSIKTHPDCDKRFKAITGKVAPQNTACCTVLSSFYAQQKERAMVEAVRFMYESNNFTYCIHLCLFAIENKYPPAFYNMMMSRSFSQIYYYETQLKRFWAVNADAYRGSNLKQLQDYLFAAANNDLIKLATYYRDINHETSSEEYYFTDMIYNTRVKGRDQESAYNAFNQKFPGSKYYYLIKPKKEK